MIDANFKVVPQSQVRNEYINGYLLVIVAIFKDNHDICFLIGRDGLDVTYYIIKYATKKQKKFENLAALQLNAFDKHISQEALPPIDLLVQIQRRQRISNMVCS
jgi:undecaprenyl pyrophosphate synthase